MTDHDPIRTIPDEGDPREERGLWHMVGPAGMGRAGMAPCPDAMELAAYLDDRLDETASDRVDGHLAACAACLAAVREGRLIREEQTMVVVPAPVVDAARRLVDDHVSSPPVIRTWAPARWAGGVAAAAACLAMCLVGYRTGATAVLPGLSSEQLRSEMSFGVFDAGDADIELLALALEIEP